MYGLARIMVFIFVLMLLGSFIIFAIKMFANDKPCNPADLILIACGIIFFVILTFVCFYTFSKYNNRSSGSNYHAES